MFGRSKRVITSEPGTYILRVDSNFTKEIPPDLFIPVSGEVTMQTIDNGHEIAWYTPTRIFNEREYFLHGFKLLDKGETLISSSWTRLTDKPVYIEQFTHPLVVKLLRQDSKDLYIGFSRNVYKQFSSSTFPVII